MKRKYFFFESLLMLGSVHACTLLDIIFNEHDCQLCSNLADAWQPSYNLIFLDASQNSGYHYYSFIRILTG